MRLITYDLEDKVHNSFVGQIAKRGGDASALAQVPPLFPQPVVAAPRRAALGEGSPLESDSSGPILAAPLTRNDLLDDNEVPPMTPPSFLAV